MWRRVALVNRTDFSEESVASIFKAVVHVVASDSEAG
jgi:hypothetical protein